MASTSEDGTPRNPLTQPAFLGSAVVVALIVVFGLVLAFSESEPGTATEAPPPAPSPTTPSASETKGSASVCGLSAGDQEVPTTAPTNTRWELVGRMVAPTATTSHGPARTNDGLRTCFAHSPLGALYASVNVVASTTAPDLWERLVRDLAVEGRGRDRALEEIGSETAVDVENTKIQVAGFSFTSYDRSNAVVNLAFQADSGGTSGFLQLPVALQWEDGDWKFAVADDGDPFTGLGQIPNLDSYVEWSGA